MAKVRKRPKQEDTDKWIQEANQTEPQVEPEETEEEEIIQSLRLRIPADLLQEIDSLVKKRKPKISRHTWILEALIDKAKREKRKN